MEQKYSSKNTSLNQASKAIKQLDIWEGCTVLDYGCGGYTKSKNHIEERGGIYFGYDPYWKSETENVVALTCNPDIVVCANVLNVIMEDEIVEQVVAELSRYNKITYIQIYEGDKSGVSAPTSRGYQRNKLSEEYRPLLQKYFTSVTRKENIFICK